MSACPAAAVAVTCGGSLKLFFFRMRVGSHLREVWSILLIRSCDGNETVRERVSRGCVETWRARLVGGVGIVPDEM